MKFPNLSRRRGPMLTICIPAYRAGGFIERTIGCVLSQSLPDWRVVIANDGGHDREAVERAGRHPNIEIVHNPARLGWVGNSNWLIRRVATKYFAILPHDDEVRPDYYAKMLDMLETNPRGQCAFSAMLTEGSPGQGIIESRSVPGSLSARIRRVLKGSYIGVTYRAVNRTIGDNSRLTIPGNRFGDMYADSTWKMRQAVRGEILYCDEPLYVKHYHASNTHGAWEKARPDQCARAWFAHCLQSAWFASRSVCSEKRRQAIRELAIERAFSIEVPGRPAGMKSAFDATWTAGQQELSKERFRNILDRGTRRYGGLKHSFAGLRESARR